MSETTKITKFSKMMRAAMAGVMAGVALAGAGCSGSDKDKAATERNGCGGPNGCGANGKEKNSCKGHNGCDGESKDKNSCKGHNGCNGEQKKEK